jgi:hypothetical protein
MSLVGQVSKTRRLGAEDLGEVDEGVGLSPVQMGLLVQGAHGVAPEGVVDSPPRLAPDLAACAFSEY